MQPRGMESWLQRLMFWWLLLMGLAVLAPAVLLPEWRHYQAVQVARQWEEHRVAQLRTRVERERQRIEAMTKEPAVVQRMAQRDLRYRNPQEEAIGVRAEAARSAADIDEAPFIPQLAHPPEAVARVTAVLPPYDYDSLFCNPATRGALIVMSVGVIGLALFLFARPQRRRPAVLRTQVQADSNEC